MNFKTLSLSIICLLCMTAIPVWAQSDTVKSTPYVIQPNDLLEISVYKNPDLSRDKTTVQPDGLISVPLVQSIQAAGLTPAQLKEAIEARLKEYIDVPTVTVIIVSIQSYRIYVIGKAQKPGSIMSEKPVTVLQALSIAGGFADFAKKNEIVIIRTIQGANGQQQEQKMNFSYDDVLAGKNQLQDIFLKSGDVVNVP